MHCSNTLLLVYNFYVEVMLWQLGMYAQQYAIGRVFFYISDTDFRDLENTCKPHKAPSTLIRFQTKRAVLLRIQLSSTLQRRKRSPKTGLFENVLQSGAIWKRCFLKTLFSTVDGENDRAPDRSTVCGFSLDRFSNVDGRKRYENDKFGRKTFWKRAKQLRFRLKSD